LLVNEEAWPTPREPSREPLPRVEDLPIAEQGYEQESVRAAFDSFYRHAAQLDAALRTLEAVESFHRQAAALRTDLRALRTAGWTQQSWNVTPAYGYATRAPREGVSPVVWRVAGEAAFLIAVAVVLGVAKLDWWLILVVMAIALGIVLLIEWAASREPFVAPRAEPAPPPVVEGEAVGEQTAEEESLGWTAFEEAQEPSDAMTIVGAPPAVEPEPEPEAVAEEQEAEPEPEPEPESEPDAEPELEPAAVAEPQPEAEPGERPRHRWWRRQSGEAEVREELPEHEPPRHVRVLSSDDESADAGDDPWERGFEEAHAPEEQTDEDVASSVDEEAGEAEPAVAVDGEQAGRRRFRRR
jgi:outer membrane biosynthesis protein TonB